MKAYLVTVEDMSTFSVVGIYPHDAAGLQAAKRRIVALAADLEATSQEFMHAELWGIGLLEIDGESEAAEVEYFDHYELSEIARKNPGGTSGQQKELFA